MRLTRRGMLLGFGVAAGGGAAVVGGAWWRYLGGPPAEGYQALSAEEVEVVDALAEAWMPPGGTPALSGREAALAPDFDALLMRMPADNRQALKALLRLLDDATWPSKGGAFRTLPLDARIGALEGWLGSDLGLVRSAAFTLIALISDAYMQRPQVVAALRPMFRCGYGP